MNPKIYVAGHQGMVGAAIVRTLEYRHCNKGDNPIRQSCVTLITRTHAELNLVDRAAVCKFFAKEKPNQVYLAAAKVAGKLEPTNEPYAIAKIAGIKLCESYNREYGKSHGIDYRSVMPTNLYSPGDNYHPENSHVIPALIRRFHEAKINNAPSVTVWETGTPKREFLYMDDMARACIHVMNLDKAIYDKYTKPMCSHINIGAGTDLTTRELAEMIKGVVGYQGDIDFDPAKPDGNRRKLMDSRHLSSLDWRPRTGLKDGLIEAYADFVTI
ncbi:MAG: NAD-dependent epimerase/dehydratase family protein [Pseudomonadota bacterium]